MSHPYRIRTEAQKEMRQAACWLDAGRKGRGMAFTNAVISQLKRIAERPDAWPLISRRVRQSPIPRWKHFSIFYEMLGDRIEILSVFHASREPKDW